MTATEAEPLSVQLRAATKTLHRQAERSGLMQTLLHGHITRSAYCRLLRSLYAIYAALEAALLQHANEETGLALINEPPLARAATLAADLETLYGSNWLEALPVAATAGRYVSRLQTLAEIQPIDLAAHAYVRYLGDLSGGQMLHGIVAKALQLEEASPGTTFYRYTVPGAAVLAERFRAGLNALPLQSEADTRRFVEEAKLGFELHQQLFEELAAA